MRFSFLLIQFFAIICFSEIATVRATRCLLRPQSGCCKAAIPRWYFDACTMFIWGGCGGVVPFITEKECIASNCHVQHCVKDPDPGPCEALIPKWFFNKNSGACERFFWGGCDGFVPFNTKRECVKAQCNPNCNLDPVGGFGRSRDIDWFFDHELGRCRKFRAGSVCAPVSPFKTKRACRRARCIANPKPSPSPSTDRERCRLIPDPGPCLEYEPKWLWNPRTSMCESFRYGGCFGKVPFHSMEECRNSGCGRPKCFIDKNDVLPRDSLCDAYWTSWYYNRKTNECESFSYSGCNNVGPFTSKSECDKADCRVKLCAFGRPMVTTDCEVKGSAITWYFDLNTRTCMQGQGDGCQYGRVFVNKEECTKANCSGVLCDMMPDDVTLVPPSGICWPRPEPWYYDNENGKCMNFTFEGCAKRLPFESMEDCQKSCH